MAGNWGVPYADGGHGECEHPKCVFPVVRVDLRAPRDRNITAYEYNYKAMNLIKINLFVHTFIGTHLGKCDPLFKRVEQCILRRKQEKLWWSYSFLNG